MLATFVVASQLIQMGVKQEIAEQKDILAYQQLNRILPPLELSLTRVYNFAIISVYLALVGSTAALWHISWIVGVVFLASYIISSFVFMLSTTQFVKIKTSEPY